MTPENDTLADPVTILRRIGAGPDDGFGLAEGALALAALDRPDASVADYRGHLDELARDVTGAFADAPDGAPLARCIAALNGTILEKHGYCGDRATYDDLDNADLMRVIDRRKGLPVTLGILYLHAARAQGWSIVGLSFPGHFLLRIDHKGARAIIDPFNDGQRHDAGAMRALLKSMQGEDAELMPEHYARVTDREILLRLRNNVKLRLMQLREVKQAAAVADSMLLFAPSVQALWRDAGLLHAQAGDLEAAVDALETYLERETGEGARHETAKLLQQLRRGLS